MKDGPFDRPDSRFNTLKGWTWIGCYGGYYLQSDLLHEQGFEHGFFTRLWHGRGPDELAGYVSAGISVHRPQQIHSGIVLNASDAPQDPWPEADGLVSDRGGQSLWVCGADCTPVLIADPGTGHAAACHAGWRGVAAGILITALDRLVERGARREDLVVALGPAVSGPCYQVGDEVVEAVSAAVPNKASLSDAAGPCCRMSNRGGIAWTRSVPFLATGSGESRAVERDRGASPNLIPPVSIHWQNLTCLRMQASVNCLSTCDVQPRSSASAWPVQPRWAPWNPCQRTDRPLPPVHRQ